MRDRVWAAERRAEALRERGHLPSMRGTRPRISPARHKPILPEAPNGFVAMQRLRCPADGSCFYHAVARAVGSGNHEVIRNLVIKELSKTKSTAQDFAAIARAKAHDWAETEEVIACANALRCRIYVFETAHNMWVQFGDDKFERCIHLINHDMVHFEPLRGQMIESA